MIQLVLFYAEGTVFDEKNALLPGMRLMLEALHERGLMTGLITGERGELAVIRLERLKLGELFDYYRFHIFDAGEAIREILAQAGETPQETMYVGDKPADISAGTRAGVHTVAFCNGTFADELIDSAGPDFSIRTLSELPDLIDRLARPTL